MPSATSKIDSSTAHSKTTDGRKGNATKALLSTSAKGSSGLIKQKSTVPVANQMAALKKMRSIVSKTYSSKLAPQKVAEVLALAAEAGTPARFIVNIDSSGTTSLELQDDVAPISEFKPEAVDAISDDLKEALAAAKVRGQTRVAQILAAPDMLSADGFAELLGTTRTTINAKRQKHEVLGLEGATRGFRFPEWQVGVDGKPFEQMALLHELLGNAWAVYRFLVQPLGELDDLTGLQALQKGRTEEVIAAAESAGRDFR